jgi:hypothetical protein
MYVPYFIVSSCETDSLPDIKGVRANLPAEDSIIIGAGWQHGPSGVWRDFRKEAPLSKVVRFYEIGGPEVFLFDDVAIEDPAPGELRQMSAQEAILK